MTKPCAVVYDQTRQKYFRSNATMFAREDGHTVYYCAEHGRERGAKEIDPANAVRAEAEVRARGRVSTLDACDAIGAVNLYVEAFIAGAQFAESRRSQAERAPAR